MKGKGLAVRVLHKSIYDPVEPRRDGYRLLVTRFWPRGVKKTAVDSWERDLGAPVELIRKKKAASLDMAELKKLYTASLDPAALERPLALARQGTLTLLCTCRDELCHRVVLAGILTRKLAQGKKEKRG